MVRVDIHRAICSLVQTKGLIGSWIDPDRFDLIFDELIDCVLNVSINVSDKESYPNRLRAYSKTALALACLIEAKQDESAVKQDVQDAQETFEKAKAGTGVKTEEEDDEDDDEDDDEEEEEEDWLVGKF